MVTSDNYTVEQPPSNVTGQNGNGQCQEIVSNDHVGEGKGEDGSGLMKNKLLYAVKVRWLI